MMKKDELIKLMTSKEHIDKFRSIKPKSKPSKPSKPAEKPAPKPKKKKFVIKKKPPAKDPKVLTKLVNPNFTETQLEGINKFLKDIVFEARTIVLFKYVINTLEKQMKMKKGIKSNVTQKDIDFLKKLTKDLETNKTYNKIIKEGDKLFTEKVKDELKKQADREFVSGLRNRIQDANRRPSGSNALFKYDSKYDKFYFMGRASIKEIEEQFSKDEFVEKDGVLNKDKNYQKNLNETAKEWRERQADLLRRFEVVKRMITARI